MKFGKRWDKRLIGTKSERIGAVTADQSSNLKHTKFCRPSVQDLIFVVAEFTEISSDEKTEKE